MTTIFVSHRSALVAYLVAAALKLHYRHRTLRIVIVELFDKSTPTDNRPYCGTSTVSNLRLARWSFLHKMLLAQVLAPLLLFAESVRVHETGPPRLSPDKPIWAQYLTVVALRGNPERFLALFYLPQLLERTLAVFLAESPNVSFLSVQSYQSIPSVIRSMSRNTGAGSPDIWLHFGTGDVNNRSSNLDILASSTLCGLAFKNGEHSSNSWKRTGGLSFDINRALPNAVLWLPLFKGAAGMFSEPIFLQQVHLDSRIVSVSVNPLNLNLHEETFASRHDLLYGLKTCDFVLGVVDNMFDRYNLDLTPHRL